MGKARIFVADDDCVFLEFMKELLEEDGYEATVLKAPHNAYEEIVDDLPDLLILDIMLERPNVGFVLLDELKLNPSTANIPVVICSGDELSLRRREEYLYKLGCLVLEKPFTIEQLSATVAQALHIARTPA